MIESHNTINLLANFPIPPHTFNNRTTHTHTQEEPLEDNKFPYYLSLYMSPFYQRSILRCDHQINSPLPTYTQILKDVEGVPSSPWKSTDSPNMTKPQSNSTVISLKTNNKRKGNNSSSSIF